MLPSCESEIPGMFQLLHQADSKQEVCLLLFSETLHSFLVAERVRVAYLGSGLRGKEVR